MRPRPSRSVAEFLRRRFEPPKVIEVLAAWALIGSRVELEEDLVAPVGDIEDETAPLSTMRAADRTIRQTQAEQRLRPGIDPLRRDAEHASRLLDRPRQRRRQRHHGEDALALYLADDVDIARWASDQTQKLQGPAANRVQLVAQPALLQELAESG